MTSWARTLQNGDCYAIIGGRGLLDGFPYRRRAVPGGSAAWGPAGQAKPFLGVQGFMINVQQQPLLAQTFLKNIPQRTGLRGAWSSQPAPVCVGRRQCPTWMTISRLLAPPAGRDAMPNIRRCQPSQSSWGTAMRAREPGASGPRPKRCRGRLQESRAAIAGS